MPNRSFNRIESIREGAYPSESVITLAEPVVHESEPRTDYGIGFSQDRSAAKTRGLTLTTRRSCRYLEEGLRLGML